MTTRWAAAIAIAAAAAFPGPVPAAGEVELDPADVLQGSWTVVRVAGGEGPGRAELLGRHVPLFPVPGGWRALVPIPLDARPGRAALVVRLRDGIRSARVTVLRRAAGPHVVLKGLGLTPEKLGVLEENHETVVTVLARVTPEARWSGPLRRPVAGIVTSPFGPTRGYGGGIEMAHKGVDFAMPGGMPIVAAAAGGIAMAGHLETYGNFVVIDHGQTVHSIYMHMTAVAVRAGDRVAAGQVIGTVGATGMARGTHLHFGTSIGTVAVDPLEMLDRGLPAETAIISEDHRRKEDRP